MSKVKGKTKETVAKKGFSWPKIKLQPKQLLLFFLVIILLALSLTAFELAFADKFYPGVFIGDTNAVYLTRAQVYQLNQSKFNARAHSKLSFNFQDQNFSLDLSTASAKLADSGYLNQAFTIGREGDLIIRLKEQLLTLLFGKIITPPVSVDLQEQITNLARVVDKPAKNASLEINGQGQVNITSGEAGIQVDTKALENAAQQYLTFGQYNHYLSLKTVFPKATSEKAQTAKEALEKLNQEPVTLTFTNQSWSIGQKELLSLINLDQNGLSFIDQNKLSDFLKPISDKINQPVVEALFNFDQNSGRVSAFKPAQQGQQLDAAKTANLIVLAVEGKRPKNISLPVEIIAPKIQTEQVNDMGIKELIGRGVSNFAGSIANRIYNVNLTATKLNGVLLSPDSVFSFNQTVGDISAATGYKQAYVIKDGRTVLDDGGGVCQDSTTLFRAVLNAGLPIVERTAHAYRVGYYEQGFPPGLDATVFYPSVDFKFKNDTGHYVLIQAYTDGLTLYVDLYGTSDGRAATISKSIVTGQIPPPADLRQDDPTLPKGTVKQVDFAAWGANVSFNRTVVRNGQTIIYETWRSNYRPWQAIYLIGTG